MRASRLSAPVRSPGAVTAVNGQIREGRAGPILPGGESVVNIDDATVLVSNAVPGDLLSVRITSKRRGVLRGEIVELLEPAAERIASPCPVADRCGGCALQSLSGELQAELKSGWVKSAFAKLIDSDSEWITAVYHEGRCRRRLRWFVGHDIEGAFLGFYAHASHNPVRHQGCMAVTPELNALRQQIEAKVALDAITSIQALQLGDGIHVIVETETAPYPVEMDKAIGVPLQWWWRDGKGITRPLQKPVIAFHDLLPAGNRDVALAVGPDGFVQGQMEGNRELIAQIIDWAGPVRRVADLFCGIGNLSLPLAVATGAEVVGAELNAASVRAALSNANALGVKANYHVANLFEAFEPEPYTGADLLILDPPRRGARRICSDILRLLPARIIMVSCDAAAGARDGALLKEKGYRLKALRALDLFPGAGHVETMSLWERC